jgi:hypothetical protein
MKQLTNKELWDALDEATLDAEMDRVLAMSPEDRDRELVEAGFDLAKVDADADAFFATLDARIAAANPAPAPAPAPAAARVRPLWRRPLIAVPAALALAAGVLLLIQALTPPPPDGRPAPRPTPADRATDLRNRALDECRHGQPKRCLDHLDQARALDPAGDATPGIQKLREMARDTAGGTEAAPP